MSSRVRFVSEVGVEDADGTRRAVKRTQTITTPLRLEPGLSLVLLPPGASPLALPPGTLMWQLGPASRFDALDQTLKGRQVKQVDEPAVEADDRRDA